MRPIGLCAILLSPLAAHAFNVDEAKELIDSALDRRVEPAAWKTRLRGRRGQLMRPFSAHDLQRSTLVPLDGDEPPRRVTTGKVVEGSLNMKTGMVRIDRINAR